MEKLARAAHALSDETRIRIINLIMIRECCVCEVMQALNVSQTRASRNLKILYDAGFLNVRNDGLYTFYSINHDNDRDFRNYLLQAVGKYIRKNPIAQEDLCHLDLAERIGPGCVKKQRR
jgi:ArsR family transcriptional regulator